MIAIYARQSVERPDSISIAMQVEHCRRICPAEAEVRVLLDRAYRDRTPTPGVPGNAGRYSRMYCIVSFCMVLSSTVG